MLLGLLLESHSVSHTDTIHKAAYFKSYMYDLDILHFIAHAQGNTEVLVAHSVLFETEDIG